MRSHSLHPPPSFLITSPGDVSKGSRPRSATWKSRRTTLFPITSKSTNISPSASSSSLLPSPSPSPLAHRGPSSQRDGGPSSPTSYAGQSKVDKDFKLPRSTSLCDRYEPVQVESITNIIGTGSFSVVKQARHKGTGIYVAMKMILKKFIFNTKERNDILREIQIHR